MVTAENGEVVCNKCGVVVRDAPSENALVPSESHLSLYHQMALGSDPQDTEEFRSNKLVYNSKDLSEFSNICAKLQLPGFIAFESWKSYEKLRHMRQYTRAMCALFSVFTACHNSGCGVPVEQIRDAIQCYMGVKRIPTLLKAFSVLCGAADEIGIIIKRPSDYYRHVAASSEQGRFEHAKDFDMFKELVTKFDQHLSGNARSRAKRAVAIALCEMGVYR